MLTYIFVWVFFFFFFDSGCCNALLGVIQCAGVFWGASCETLALLQLWLFSKDFGHQQNYLHSKMVKTIYNSVPEKYTNVSMWITFM